MFGPSSLGRGAWPDGIAFDTAGNLWHARLLGQLFVLTPNGDMRVLLDEGTREVAALEQAFFEHRDRRGAVCHQARLAPWMASVTFGGGSPSGGHIGSLKGSRIPSFRSPVPGLPMVHWNEMPSVRA